MIVVKWKPEEEALLREVWPVLGKKCFSLFPNRTHSSIRARVVMLGLRKDAERCQKAKPTRCARRDARTSYGWLPTGPVASVFELARFV